ncbi:MAG: AsmA-like C-terminal region-containing protein [Terracidiphilus sp.]
MTTVREQVKTQAKPFHRSVWFWPILSLVLLGVALLLPLQILVDRAAPIVKGRVIHVLSVEFNSKVELDDLQVSVWHGLNISGAGLRIFPSHSGMATEPLIAVKKFDFHSAIVGLLLKPAHVGTVYVHGLVITIPPKSMHAGRQGHSRLFTKMEFVVDQTICDDSRLIIGTSKPNKDPLVFEMTHIVFHGVGRNSPWDYDAALTNAIPKGNIRTSGTFGPLDTESPGDSNVNGKYVFDQADLSTIRGIGGILHSVGTFDGQLSRIDARGSTDTPDFSLDTANRPMPLSTTFSATIDGMTGDTYLNKVDAKLAESTFSCKGWIVNEKGKGHTIDLDVDVPAGRIEDFLELAVKTTPPVISGVIQSKTNLHIGPGTESVSQKLDMRGEFTVRDIHFTNPSVEDKVDRMSLRAKGDPQEAKPGAPDVQSTMAGHFEMNDGRLNIPDLDYDLPGATVHLSGVYTLDGKQFDFTGKVRTKADLSHMVASKWKSILLKPIDPWFRKHGAGAEIPVKISGTGGTPHFGLNLGGEKEK